MAVPSQENPKKKKRDHSYLLNPLNWGTEDYTSEGTFNSAFRAAKKGGAEKFAWNGKVYNTKSNAPASTQMALYGITDEQAKGKSRYSERAYKAIQPNDYVGNEVVQKFNDFFDEYDRLDSAQRTQRVREINKLEKEAIAYYDRGERGKGNELWSQKAMLESNLGEDSPNSEDAWRLYLGLPQRYGTFRASRTRPSVSKDSAMEYFAMSENFEKDLMSSIDPDTIRGRTPMTEWDVKNASARALGNFSIDRGTDDQGDYISYYDRFDLHPWSSESGEMTPEGIGKPFEIYNRIRLPKKAFGGVLGDNDPKPITGDPNDPKKRARRVSPQVVQMYHQRINKSPLATVEEEDPIFYNQNEFNSFYRKKAVSKLTPEQLEVYNDVDPAGTDAVLMSFGGVPDFTTYHNAVREYEKSQITNPTDWANLDSQASSYKPAGYRYKVGKPDVESITLPRKRIGGTIDPKPKYTQENIDAARDIRRIFEESYVPPDYSRTPWLNPEREWFGGDTALGKSNDLYIDDAGNLKLKPKKKKPNPLFAAPIAQQDATRVSRPVRTMFMKNNGGVLEGPSHENGGITAIDRTGAPVAEVEGGERLFSVEDTREIESLIGRGRKSLSPARAALLGRRVKEMIERQDRQ